eukprot:1231845-Prymnesium_polylepis.1
MTAAAESRSPYCAAKAAEPARARGPAYTVCGRACECISLPGARTQQSGRARPTGRLGTPLNGGTPPQYN